MRIAIIGAGGKAGRLIAAEAKTRGMEVVGFGRSPKPGVAVIKDVSALRADDLAGFDAVVDALSFPLDQLSQHTTSLLHLAELVAGSDTRLLAVGGAGSLYVDQEHTTQLFETPQFPDMFKPIAAAQAEQLAKLRERDDVRWTYISPAADFRPDGPRTGEYQVAGEEFTMNADGKSTVSYADFAAALVDELEAGEHIRERISVNSK